MKTFNSKIDLWFIVLMTGVILYSAYQATASFYSQPITFWVSVIFGGILPVSFLAHTRYTIRPEALVIYCGIFRWKLAFNSNSQLTIEPSKTMLSSPALSLKRIKVQIDNRSIIISPSNTDKFSRALTAAISDLKN